MKLLAPTTNTSGICPLPLVAEYSLASGATTTHGFVGTREAMQAAYETLIDAGYRNVRFEEQESGIVRVTGTFGAVNKDDPNNPTENEKPEITWELIGNDESADLNAANAAIKLEFRIPGILKGIESAVEKYRSVTTGSDIWDTTKWVVAPSGDHFDKEIDPDAIAKLIATTYDRMLSVVKSIGNKNFNAEEVTDAESLFKWKIKGVTQFQFTRWALRKSVAFSSLKSSISQELIEGIFQNTDKYFTGDLVISRETTLPAALSYSIPKTYTDPLTNKVQGYYLKHMPHVQTSSTGRVTATVEYAYTLDLCDFAYQAAI